MTRDIYNVDKVGAVGPGAQNIVNNPPAAAPTPRKPLPLKTLSAIALAVLGLAGMGYFGLPLLLNDRGPSNIEIASAPGSAALVPATSGPSSGPRLALVIEQSDYTEDLSDITLAKSEADLIEAALNQTGFSVSRIRNQKKPGLSDALDAFRAALENAGPDAIGFVYYTGHGVQHPKSGDSYLLGVDAKLDSAGDLGVYGLDMKSQRDGFALTGAQAVFLVFDACRNIALPGGWKAGTKGMGRIEATPDMLIAYSTRLNDVAEEGIYAPILAEELVRPGQTAETAFSSAQRRVAKATNREQVPFTDPDLINEICFASCPGSPASAPTLVQVPAGPAEDFIGFEDLESILLTEEQSLLLSNGFGEAAMAKAFAAEAAEVERQARNAAYRMQTSGTGCSDAIYTGECDAGNGVRHGVDVYGGASLGEVFAGRFENGVRALGKFQHPEKAGNPIAVRYYLGQFGVENSNARGNWNGHGTAEYQDGSVYAGQVRSGEKHGYGECTLPDGVVVYARWQQNVRKQTFARNALGDTVDAPTPICGSP